MKPGAKIINAQTPLLVPGFRTPGPQREGALMTIIAEKDRPAVRDLLARELVDDVELLLFTRGRSRLFVPGQHACQSCEETHELLDELVALSDQLHLTVHDVDAEPSAATRYNVAVVPTVIIRRRAGADASATGSTSAAEPAVGTEEPDASRATAAELGANVRFLGLPGGYEFSTLLADVVDVSKGRTDLSPAALEAVRAIDTPVHIQVFVTPT
jgi:hypothetical protein